MNTSVLTKHQAKTFRAEYRGDRPGEKMLLIATVRHDDRCGNGHNTFSITGDIYSSKCPNSRDGVAFSAVDGKRRGWISGGCAHEEIARRIKVLRPFIKWHLCDADGGPMHYKANALYWAGHCQKFGAALGVNYPANWDHFASTAKLGALPGDPPLETLQKLTAEELGAWLDARLPALMVEFRAAVEALGLVF